MKDISRSRRRSLQLAPKRMYLSVAILDRCALLLLLYVVYNVFLARRRRLPPGPKGWPLIGNLYDLPPSEEWIAYREFGREFNSDIIHLNLMGTSLIVVNTRDAARDLFERRSSMYSDRPPFPMLNGLVGFGWNFAFGPYGDSWREHRKLAHIELQSKSASERYQPLELRGARFLLQTLMDDPDDFSDHIRLMAGKVILMFTYGIDVQSADDYYVRVSERTMQAMAATGNAGAFLVDSIPSLRYLPDWFPGAGFKKKAKEWRRSVSVMPDVSLKFTEDALAQGTARDSVASKRLSEIQEDGGSDSEHVRDVLRNTLGTMYGAGADTTVSALRTFLLAMIENPDVLKKAQKAVTEAIGSDRLPDFSDYHQVPYIDAILCEVLRWRPVTPLAVPHSVTRDDEYNGFYIPKDAIIVGNSWAMLRDEAVYGPRTDKFDPERFLKDGRLNPDIPHPNEAFGFGRRICAGQAMAEASIWITIASIVSVFDVSVYVDKDGTPIPPSASIALGCFVMPNHSRFLSRQGARRLSR
ncbi:cytochrome P450 [Mucidula mucida]|nr:cytochrome P450 [Mucidula mucida]